MVGSAEQRNEGRETVVMEQGNMRPRSGMEDTKQATSPPKMKYYILILNLIPYRLSSTSHRCDIMKEGGGAHIHALVHYEQDLHQIPY